jgi:prepilin-type N-terminal cleavage/methylation domain-containing protein
MNKTFLKRKKERGFTIVELLATIAVFSLIAMSVSLIYGQNISNQRRASAAQDIQDNALYAFELIAKEIRVSTLNSGNFACSGAGTFGTSLSITHPVNGAVVYSLNAVTGLIERTEGGVTTNITSRDVKFSNLYFCITGAGIDNKQARVMMTSKAENVTGLNNAKLSLQIQTTVALRSLAE